MKIDPDFIKTFKALPTPMEMAKELAKRCMSSTRAALEIGMHPSSLARIISGKQSVEICSYPTYRKLVIAYLNDRTYTVQEKHITLTKQLKEYQEKKGLTDEALADKLNLKLERFIARMEDREPLGIRVEYRIEELLRENK